MVKKFTFLFFSYFHSEGSTTLGHKSTGSVRTSSLGAEARPHGLWGPGVLPALPECSAALQPSPSQNGASVPRAPADLRHVVPVQHRPRRRPGVAPALAPAMAAALPAVDFRLRPSRPLLLCFPEPLGRPLGWAE